MANQIPSVDELQARLAPLGHGEITKLSRDSGVPVTTLWKVRIGETRNPGVETVRKFWPLLLKLSRKTAT